MTDAIAIHGHDIIDLVSTHPDATREFVQQWLEPYRIGIRRFSHAASKTS